MTPLILGLGPSELLIILAIVLLLFGGSRLAGLGKSSGRALREFKEETRTLKNEDPPAGEVEPGAPTASDFQVPQSGNVAEPEDREPPQRPLS